LAKRSQGGQASVELLGVLPLLVALALGAMQLLAVGYASVLAGSAAEAGALALAGGAGHGGARAGVREALPGWSRADAQVSVDGGRVTVRLRPPSLLQAVAERLEVTADASVEAL
jgi:pilus assembly protein CpaE